MRNKTLAAAVSAGLISIVQNGVAVANFDAGAPWTSTFTPTEPPPPSNVPPQANFTFAANGQTVTFTDASVDPDGLIIVRAWDFGDGQTSAATSPVHHYASPGTFTAKLTVTDNGSPALTNARVQTIAVVADAPPPPVTSVETTFDTLYAPSFRLNASLSNRTPPAPVRPAKSANLQTPSYTDAFHSTKVFRMTDIATEASPGGGQDHLRHEYSKRVVWNADSSRYIAQDGAGAWYLYNAATFAKIGGSLPGFSGDCEPIWHPTDPRKLWHTGRDGGGLAFLEFDIVSLQTTQLFTLAGKLPAGFAGAARAWFKGEGRPSNDGRYWALMIETDGFGHLGTVMFDRTANAVVGYLQTTSRPDHVMTSPLGTRFLCGYGDGPNGGVRSFARNYQGSSITAGIRLSFAAVEHGDVAIDGLGTEVYVQADYASGSPTEGYLRVANVTTGAFYKIPAAHLYPASGEATSLHVSGILSGKRPGWLLAEFESCYADYGREAPAATCRYLYDRIVAIELKPTGGRWLNIAEHFSSGGSYFNEPQASSNLDGTRIAFASAFNGRAGADSSHAESYMVALPSWALA